MDDFNHKINETETEAIEEDVRRLPLPDCPLQNRQNLAKTPTSVESNGQIHLVSSKDESKDIAVI